MIGLGLENCGSKIRATTYLVYVSCPSKGIIEAFRVDTLVKVHSYKLSTFTSEWDVIDTDNGVQAYVFLPMLASEGIERSYRLTVIEFIVDFGRFFKRRGGGVVWTNIL